MNRYVLKVMKPPNQEVLEEYPNLTSDVYIELKTVKTKERLDQVKDKKAKSFVEKVLRKGKLHINPDYPLDKREVVRVHGKHGVDWKGKVKIPEKAVKKSRELDEKQEISMK